MKVLNTLNFIIHFSPKIVHSGSVEGQQVGVEREALHLQNARHPGAARHVLLLPNDVALVVLLLEHHLGDEGCLIS